MNPWTCPALVLGGNISLAHIKPPLIPTEHCLNATAYLSIVADNVHPFMATVYPPSNGYFQQDNAPCHKAHVISSWFHQHGKEFRLFWGQRGVKYLPSITKVYRRKWPISVYNREKRSRFRSWNQMILAIFCLI